MGLKADEDALNAEVRALRDECEQKVKVLLAKKNALSVEDTFQVGEKSYKFVQRPGSGELYNTQKNVLIALFNSHAAELTVAVKVSSITFESVDALGICKSLILAKQ